MGTSGQGIVLTLHGCRRIQHTVCGLILYLQDPALSRKPNERQPAKEPMSKRPLHSCVFLGCDVSSWSEAMPGGLQSKPTFKFLLEFFQGWAVAWDPKPIKTFSSPTMLLGRVF